MYDVKINVSTLTEVAMEILKSEEVKSLKSIMW